MVLLHGKEQMLAIRLMAKKAQIVSQKALTI